MIGAPESPFAVVHDVLNAHIGHYSVLQLGVGAAAIGGTILAARWAFGKVFNQE